MYPVCENTPLVAGYSQVWESPNSEDAAHSPKILRFQTTNPRIIVGVREKNSSTPNSLLWATHPPNPKQILGAAVGNAEKSPPLIMNLHFRYIKT